jgi:crossover junction endodeoxyribonuclease RuvC
VDTALRSTGVGIVEARGHRLSAVAYGCVRNPAARPLSACLVELHRGVGEFLDSTAPEAVALEGAFFCKNARTAMVLGEARGVVIALCAGRGLPIYEYAPRKIKQAVAGYGAADKSQVRRMVMSLLGLREEPQEDAGDALAIAICHLHARTTHAALMPERI